MKRTEHTPNSSRHRRPRFWLLDALVDAPSSFAASLIFIRKAWSDEGADHLSVEEQLGVLRVLERDGYVEVRREIATGGLASLSANDRDRLEIEYRTWLADLSSITSDDVAYDRVGIWIALTAEGRREWARLGEEGPCASV